MKRYLRTTWLFWSTSLSAEMEYRANFIMAVIMSMMMLVGTLYGLHLLFNRLQYAPGGWTYHDAMLPVGLYFIIDGFADCMLRPNVTRIVEHVREGTLDFVLLKPIDHQFWLSTRNCSPWGLPTIVAGFGVVIYGGVSREVPLGLDAFLLGVIPMFAGLLILYSVWFMLSTLTIWFVKLYNITHALRSLLEAGKFPVYAYDGPWRLFFTFIIPVAFMTTVPAQVMLGRNNATMWFIAAAVLAIALFMASRVFWRFALRYYTSASS